MGAANSKASPDSQYVFAADSPVSFSQSVVSSLQSSPETDSVRARNLELQVQARVAAELERIRDQEAQRLAQLTERLTPTEAEPSQQEDSSLTSKIADAVTPSAFKSSDRSNASVSKEIADLKAKLERRKKLDNNDPVVDKAKESLVACLRINDRRPLDCWEEVESFKREVARLEHNFIDRALK